MSTINIGANNADDAFYRYKMPKLQSRVEGRGNGVKTNVVNMVEIAKALGRPPSYTTKYFGCELGAQSKFSKDSGQSIVNGAHDSRTLSEVLEGFIKKFVQCYSCGNPETVIEVDKKDFITLTCKACGHVSEVDPRHKLNTFIIKNPPKNKSTKKKAVDKMRRQDREREELGEQLDAETAKKDKSKKKKEKSERKEKREKRKKDKESVDSPKKAAAEDTEEVTEKLSDMCFTPEQKMIISLREMLDEKASSKDIAKYALNSEAIEGLEIRMKLLVEAVFGNCSKSLAEYTVKKCKYFKAAAKDEAKQLALLAGIEHFVGTRKEYTKETPLVLKALYDADAAEEEAVLKWFNNKAHASSLGVDESVATAVRKHASPFINWLETAESDEESSEEESD
ncbi:translation initiation factor IF2/IF5 [Chloropicon primus]|uniref:Translation initiation factor IF2/IF5 n=1 Tax=Chloropicon primus TaxID=1764295 RepID=A0A5B8MWX9_9CHLO|nr:translation initiation factor IF2/IF5 [Chloropicon primus]UPR04196.1 translation initiation factor IF2/IF5 [Chloropicon primus]|mmetsp:Transcript_13746/g.38722  ORF Transcript_13746/g.38722 Transcript_13746/m.38722 type:complete len:395 (+) Transcript_13746:698-1882(+)|eukprot:QDZ24987.1 translation initiation factor IF2/IF5 [Chloropicon primus]